MIVVELKLIPAKIMCGLKNIKWLGKSNQNIIIDYSCFLHTKLLTLFKFPRVSLLRADVGTFVSLPLFKPLLPSFFFEVVVVF